jgi:hypothetical protein
MRKKKRIFRKSAGDIFRSALIPIIFTLAIMGMMFYGLRQTEESNRTEGLRILEESLRRAVIMAYAVEGRYPESIAYIEENFGIHIDRDRFIVHYDIFASNLMPDIRVVDLR